MRNVRLKSFSPRLIPGLFVWMILVQVFLSCSTPEASLADVTKFTEDDQQYRRMYVIEFDSLEKPQRYGYHYVVSKMPDGFRVRVFHPDNKILIEDKTYSTTALTLPHGQCRRYWDDGTIREQGHFTYGRKHGIWVECEPERGKCFSGTYINHRKEGEWTQLDSNGLIEATYTWKDDKLHGKFFLYDSNGLKINEGLYRSDTLLAELFKRPKTEKPYLRLCQDSFFGDVYTCSESMLIQSIYTHLKYPQKAKALKIEGAALVQWDVMPDGSVQNLRVPQGLCNEIEQECLRVFKSMPEWAPARKDGMPIKHTMSVPIQFKL